MVKSLISMLVVSALLFFGALFENHYVSTQFSDFHKVLCTLYEKVDENVALQEDVYAVQDNWLEKKKRLHAFIPHNEIKEIELWISEAVKCVKEGKFADASIKLEVVAELCEQVPKNFKFSFENIL